MRRFGTVTALVVDDVEEPRIEGRRLFAAIIGWPARMPTAFVMLPPDLLDLKPDATLAASPLAVAHAWEIGVVPEPTQRLMRISANMTKPP
jgi:hypothetical protein